MNGLVRVAGALLLLGLTACAGGTPPVFEAPRSLSSPLSLLQVEVRAGERSLGVAPVDAGEALQAILRDALAERSLTVREAVGDDPVVAGLRARLLQALQEQTASSQRRLRRGTPLLKPAQLAAGEIPLVALGVLGGGREGGGGAVSVGPPELIPMPEDRPDYRVPRTSAGRNSVELQLDLIVADRRNGQVVLHRRVAYPLARAGGLIDALEILAREATRGLTP